MINTPRYLLLTDTGLSITDSSVKFVRLKQGMFSSTLTLDECEEILLPQGTIQSGFIQDEDKLTNILKDLAKRKNLHYVNATLPEERGYLFNVLIDKVPAEGLRDAVAFIIEENAPVSLANSVFHFDVTGESEGKLKVTVAVISRKVVDFYIQVLEHSGIIPVSLDLESQAIARAITIEGEGGVKLIIDLGRGKLGFYIVSGGVVRFTTTLPQDSNLKNEIEKIFAFWEEHSPDNPIERSVLSGAKAAQSKLLEGVRKLSPVPVDIANPWARVAYSEEEMKNNCESLNLVAAIGSAIPHLDV